MTGKLAYQETHVFQCNVNYKLVVFGNPAGIYFVEIKSDDVVSEEK